MRKGILFFLMTLSLNSYAEIDWALGYGSPFGGGIGANARYQTNVVDVYIGAGLLSYSNDKANLGWQIGLNAPVSDQVKIGASYGTVSSSSVSRISNNETYVYEGFSLNGTFHFSSTDNAGWFIGASAYRGDVDEENAFTDDTDQGFNFIGGYQF